MLICIVEEETLRGRGDVGEGSRNSQWKRAKANENNICRN